MPANGSMNHLEALEAEMKGVDFAAAEQFLQLLDPAATSWTFQLFDDSKRTEYARIMHGSFRQHRDELARENFRGCGIYITVNETDGKGRKAANIKRIRALFQEDDRQFSGSYPAPPSLVVESSPGKFHRYWLCCDRWLPDEFFTGAMERMVSTYTSDKGVIDISRVLRLPGFLHMKDRSRPFRVRTVEAVACRYTRAQLLAAFPPIERSTASQTDFRAPPPALLVRAALKHVEADDYDRWIKVSAALKEAYGACAFPLWCDWSSGEDGFTGSPKWADVADPLAKWNSFKGGRGKLVTVATILHLAKEAGWNGKADPRDEFSSASKTKTFTTKELGDMHFKKERYIADRLISEGCSLLGARPKAGKSWMALDLARAVAIGGEFLGRKCEQGTVLYLALEDGPRRLKMRYAKLVEEESDWTGELHFSNEWPRGKAAIDEMRKWVADNPNARLIIVDTYQRIKEAPKSKNGANYADDYDAGAMIQAFSREIGVSILLIHHTKKADADDVFDTLSGTLGNNAAADSLMVIKANRQGHMMLHAKGRDLADYAMPVEFDKAQCRWIERENSEELERSATENAIIEALKNAEKPLSTAEIRDATGLDYSVLRMTLMRKIGTGMWRKTGRGKYELAPNEDFSPLL